MDGLSYQPGIKNKRVLHHSSLNADGYLLRDRLLDVIRQQDTRPCVIVIQGQAGQGKTILALQYADLCEEPSLLYQFDESSLAPLKILSGLLDLFSDAIDDFECPILEEIIKQGDISAGDYSRLIKILIASISRATQGRTVNLLLDDFHVLKNHKHVILLITSLIQQAPVNLQLILTSRLSIHEILGEEFKTHGWLHIDNDMLAFTRDETHQMFEQLHQHCLLPADCSKLLNKTRGWALGLSLLARQMDQGISGIDMNVSWDASINYKHFTHSLLMLLDEPLQKLLLEVALLDEIYPQLIKEVVGHEQATAFIEVLRDHNLFLYLQNRIEGIYVLHPLVREILRRYALDTLPVKRIEKIYNLAADYYSATGEIEKAANYLINARNYPGFEKLISGSCLMLLGQKKILGLAPLFEKLPQEIVHGSAWLSLISAEIALNTHPFSAYSFLVRARELFARKGHASGELVTLAQLINFHGTVDGAYIKGEPLLERAEQLYPDVVDKLDDYMRIHVNIYLAGAHLFTHANHERCSAYLEDARSLVQAHGMDDLQARVGFFLCYQHMVAGDLVMAKVEMEHLYKMMANPRVSNNDRIMFMGAVANWLYNTGELDAFDRHCNMLGEMVDESLLSKTVMGMFLLRWKAQAAIARGQYAQAQLVLGKAMENGYAAANPHLRSQFLQYQAIILAIQGHVGRARNTAQESYLLRQQAGETNQVNYNHLSLGICFLLLGDNEAALFHLNKAIEHAITIRKYYVQVAAFAYRVLVWLRRDDMAQARQDAQKFVEIMQAHNYTYLESWVPELLTEIFGFAVKSNIAPRFISKLAARHLDCAFDDKGNAIPLLKIHTLGGLRFLVSNEAAIGEDSITANQRMLLGMLLSKPDLCLNLSELQMTLWRDGADDKIRTKQDALLSRLRKTLRTILGKTDIKNYLLVQNGFLCLKNCIVDHHRFEQHADQGVTCMQEGKYWEAELNLSAACAAYTGEFLPNIDSLNQALNERVRLLEKHINCVNMLADIYSNSERFSQALELLKDALRLNPADEGLARKLYCSYISLGQHSGAMRLIKRFHASLKLEGCEEDDIQSVIYQITGKKSLNYLD